MPRKVTCRKFLFGLVIAGVGAVCFGRDKAEPAPQKDVTLMGVLAEWMYPGATFEGAQMSDGGNRTILSVKCKSILITSDPFDKVVAYYEHKFVSGPDRRGASLESTPPQAVASQDDSSNRPLHLRVIVVNRSKSSTTLVISRAAGEPKTHVAWSYFQNLTAD
jgi:hypothetical protein